MSIRILEAEPHNIFQQVACDLPYDKLPLNREVIGRILKIRIQKMVELDKTESQVRITDIIKQLVDETITVWDRASIPSWLSAAPRVARAPGSPLFTLACSPRVISESA